MMYKHASRYIRDYPLQRKVIIYICAHNFMAGFLGLLGPSDPSQYLFPSGSKFGAGQKFLPHQQSNPFWSLESSKQSR